jgi:hypothetical protein
MAQAGTKNKKAKTRSIFYSLLLLFVMVLMLTGKC